MKQKVKAKHALNWLHGNICVRKCRDYEDKQRVCYERMRSIIAGHEDFLIAHKLFIQVMRQKHKICDLGDAEFYKRDPNFWRHK
ncbi:hypothetical protein HZB07_06330 [Candidatus Saganbacteria bacterium]|nr:hypothetical protein [Candidatus Saganbacteria bacterium]